MSKIARSSPQLEWVFASKGQIPPNAVQGGVEPDGKPLFVARQFHDGGLHVGKAAPHLGGLNIGYGGKEVHFDDYYVLVGDARCLKWVEAKGPVQPQNWIPLEGGHEQDGKELFIGKTRYEGGEHIGKVGTHFKQGINFGYGGKEKQADSYYVLSLV
ncbi:hypothetical protein K493DRAFT_315259 [Basidiobolus meristosporus CBS 931.73]|uniref:Uncharacterized protein n=1 Tax=Basidiobolus meristosporus CBS 931.73 TaxID=1314790 RepID=A0A1Y1YAB5_9FUNG|nr:hypothetical protein K493DRAFT_315259 [Basidiobolus meristosporus CBS 931.73]|eukprot:ORX94950.1 hypothetical protein K493DRAFT_315259 [Basidiobolus meristosporus CBS 931.73]